MCPLASKAEIEIRKQEFPKPVNCRLAVLDVRFGSKADMCTAIGHVRFTPNSDIDCVLRHVRFAPKPEMVICAQRWDVRRIITMLDHLDDRAGLKPAITLSRKDWLFRANGGLV